MSAPIPMKSLQLSGRVTSLLLASTLSFGLLLSGCEEDTPEQTLSDGGSPDGGVTTCAPDPQTFSSLDNSACKPASTDYTPRDQGSANDSWAACISDDNQYHRFEQSISSIARVGAFEQIAKLLSFGKAVAPSPQQFIDARVAYTADQGLESRLSRREDEHFPAAPSKCRDLTPEEQQKYADRCVGPAKMRPIINDAFQQGSEGRDPAINAAKIEATLLWFLYVSSYKESTTCSEKPKDCDSSWAYYTGGEPRSGGLGLSRYVKLRSTQAHDRIWDGLLAVRCWRDLDNPSGVAADEQMHAQALQQLSTALDRGLAVIVQQRLDTVTCPASWAFLKIAGPALDRAAKAQDPDKAERLADTWKLDSPDKVDVDATKQLLESLFPCP